ncbi:MAG: DUF6463 family protein [Actinomycetota bacterium]
MSFRNEAIEAIDQLHDAQARLYSDGDPEPLRRVLSKDIVWHVPGTSPIAGTYRGPEQVIDYMLFRRRLVNATFRMQRRDVLTADGPTVAVLTDGEATVEGVQRRWSTVGIYRLSAGRVVECRLVPFDQAGFDDISTPARDLAPRERPARRGGLRPIRPSPGRALGVLGVGHTAWGAVAYGDVFRELARSGFVGSIGDGIFHRRNARGPRAAAFWFTFSAPLMILLGYNVERAAREREAEVLAVTGWSILALGAVGVAAMPRSGFWGALPVASWMIRSGRRLRAEPATTRPQP